MTGVDKCIRVDGRAEKCKRVERETSNLGGGNIQGDTGAHIVVPSLLIMSQAWSVYNYLALLVNHSAVAFSVNIMGYHDL